MVKSCWGLPSPQRSTAFLVDPSFSSEATSLSFSICQKALQVSLNQPAVLANPSSSPPRVPPTAAARRPNLFPVSLPPLPMPLPAAARHARLPAPRYACAPPPPRPQVRLCLPSLHAGAGLPRRLAPIRGGHGAAHPGERLRGSVHAPPHQGILDHFLFTGAAIHRRSGGRVSGGHFLIDAPQVVRCFASAGLHLDL